MKRSLLLLFLFVLMMDIAHANAPEILLLKTYNSSQNIVGWLMSEKLDGVRGVWDGHTLRFRSGKPIHAPEWFIKKLPPFAVDGELWTKRDDFSNIVSIVRQQQPDERWHEISYNIFEVPNQQGGIRTRLAVLSSYLKVHPVGFIHIIPQIQITSQQQFKIQLKEVLDAKGEGLVVRQSGLAYETGRSNHALKVKPFKDDECVVTGYKAGTGKYSNQTGALVCQLSNGKSFYIGSGLTDGLRAFPPKLGTQITFKYQKLTTNGLPRHPVYLRERPRN